MDINLIGGDKPPIFFSLKPKKESKKIVSKNYEKETLKNAYNKRYVTNTRLRIITSLWLIILIPIWLLGVMNILWNNENTYCLSDNVLNVLLGTTTINVLGMMYIVLRDLFAGKSEEEPKSPK